MLNVIGQVPNVQSLPQASSAQFWGIIYLPRGAAFDRIDAHSSFDVMRQLVSFADPADIYISPGEVVSFWRVFGDCLTLPTQVHYEFLAL
jgi:hypothetical protein